MTRRILVPDQRTTGYIYIPYIKDSLSFMHRRATFDGSISDLAPVVICMCHTRA